MLLHPIPQFRRRRGEPKSRLVAAPPLVLTAAVSDAGAAEPFVHLQFDRAVDIAAIDGSQIVILDGPAETRFVATGAASFIDAQTIQILLNPDGAASGADILLSAGGATGITAVADGGTWPGVSDLLLPFP